MEKYDDFNKALIDFIDKFKLIDKNISIKIVSHLDCDGIISAAILTKACKRENIKFSLSILKQITKNSLEEISNEPYKTVLFVDLGSGSLDLIEEILKEKNIFILDHHIPQKVTSLNQLNPHAFGISDYREISGAGLAYLFSKTLNSINIDTAFLAIIGAIGDIQENNGFKGLNELILKDAISSKKLTVERGLKMFGYQTRPIHKVLEYSTDPYIPEITGSEDSAIKFLSEIGIPLKDGVKFRKLIDLNKEELQKLSTEIILKRIGQENNPQDIFGNIYILSGNFPTNDAREFSTLLNACGRLSKSSVGIAICLENKKAKEESLEILSKYKQELINSLNWVHNNRGSANIIENEHMLIIKAENNVRETIIGTISSILLNSPLFNKKIILGLAHTLDNNVKVSIRSKMNINSKEILSRIMDNNVSGGHRMAAGALITRDKEEEFINKAANLFKTDINKIESFINAP